MSGSPNLELQWSQTMCMNKESTFTRIISGELPSHTIYEDETIYAFLDADPHASGHTLVIPKQPYERLHELPKEEAMHLFETLWELVPIILIKMNLYR